MKKFIGLFMMLAGVSGIVAAPPEGYYSSLEGKAGDNLKSAVKTVGKKGHNTISYGSSTWDAFLSTDVRVVNGKQCWWDMYSSNNVSIVGHDGLNIEHSVANSWWGGTKNDAYKDIVHLNPSNAEANNRKGNYPLGEIATVTWDNGVTFVGKPVSGQGGGSTYVYEPHDDYKGDFARAFFYMFTIYDDIAWKDNCNWMFDNSGSKVQLREWAYQLMLKWTRNDPVSQKEIDRNEGIYKEQGNRNPFIDNPDLAEYIWGNKKGESFKYDGTYQPGDDPDNPDDPDDPVGVAGEYVLVTKTSNLTTDGTYIVTASTNGAYYGMSTTLGGKYLNPTAEITVTNGVISKIPTDMAIVKLEAVSGGYALHIYDVNGKSAGYISSTTAKSLTLANSATSDGVAASLTVDGQNVTVSYGSSVGRLQYNASAPRFLTYTSNQQPLQFFRKVDEDPEQPIVLDEPVFTAVDGEGNVLDNNIFSDICYLEISNSDNKAGIFYTLDGTPPTVKFNNNIPAATGSTITYSGSRIELTATTTVRAIAAREGGVSNETAATYTYEAPVVEIDAPTLNAQDEDGNDLINNTFTNICNVEISHPDSDVKIYYTLDGSTPDVIFSDKKPMAGSVSTLEYDGHPFSLTATTTVKAVAAKENSVSPEAMETYTYDKYVGVDLERYLEEMVGVYGNNILVPAGSVIYDLNGREVSGLNSEPGVYIIVNATYGRPVKIVIR